MSMQKLGIVAALALILSQSALWSDSQTLPEIAVTGRLLYVSCPVHAEVFLDGESKGATPVLLSLAPGSFALELRAQGLVDRKRLTCTNSEPGALVRYEGVLGPFPSSLDIRTEPSGASILVDGKAVGLSPLSNLALSAGSHEVTASLSGRVVATKVLSLPPDGRLQADLSLPQGYSLRFDPALPPGALVVLLDAAGKPGPALAVADLPLVPAGPLSFKVLLPRAPAIPGTWDPASGKACNLEWKGELRFSKLPPKTTIQVDGLDRTAALSGSSLFVPAGAHTITLQVPGYLPNFQYCLLAPGEVLAIDSSFQPSRAVASQSAKASSWVYFLSGAGLLASGILLNQDDTAIGLASNYDSYKNLKYLSIAAMSLGGVGVTIGGIGVVSKR